MADEDQDRSLREILDERIESGPHAPHTMLLAWLLAGVALGAVVTLLAFRLHGSSGRQPPTETPVAETTSQIATTTTTTYSETGPFPLGYTEVAQGMAIAVHHVIILPDQVVVTGSTATRTVPDSAAISPVFLGGEFELVLSSGGAIESIGCYVDPRAPGTFSVVFPVDSSVGASAVPISLTMTAEWRAEHQTAETEIELDGIPYGLDLPLNIDLEGQGSISITSLSLRERSGEVSWETPLMSVESIKVTILLTDAQGGQPQLLFAAAGGSSYMGPLTVVPMAAQPAGISRGRVILEVDLRQASPVGPIAFDLRDLPVTTSF